MDLNTQFPLDIIKSQGLEVTIPQTLFLLHYCLYGQVISPLFTSISYKVGLTKLTYVKGAL